jgi:hypothetical protein
MSPRTSGTSPRMRSAPINKCRASATAMTSNGLRQTQTARSSSWALCQSREIKMPYSLFHSRFPKVAERETRTVTVINSADFNLPPARYSFLEMFCDEPGCDCRRVFFSVVSSLQKDIQAVITWGWEEREFYVTWMGNDDPRMIRDLIGPALNLASPQSNIAPALLDLFRARTMGRS